MQTLPFLRPSPASFSPAALPPPPPRACTWYVTRPGDNCYTLTRDRPELSVAALLGLNPGLSCQGQLPPLVCIAAGGRERRLSLGGVVDGVLVMGPAAARWWQMAAWSIGSGLNAAVSTLSASSLARFP